MSKRLSRLLLVVLVTSMALNVFLLVRRSRARPAPSDREQSRSGTQVTDCCRGLAFCQRQRWALALQALRGRTAARRPPRPPRARPTPAPAPVPAAVGPTEQQAALCAIATEQLRKDWTAKGDSLTASLRRSLADDKDQEQGMRSEVKRFGNALSLSPADRDRLETHYGPLRKRRIADALAALNREPAGWGAVLGAARALWTDQDRLVKELFGSDAVGRIRQAEVRSRTAVMALVAAQAGLDWNQSILW
jgi:hypothetical protein